MRMINIYRDFAVHTAAMPVVVGRKSRLESFAGVGSVWDMCGAALGNPNAKDASCMLGRGGVDELLPCRWLSAASPGSRALQVWQRCEICVGQCWG